MYFPFVDPTHPTKCVHVIHQLGIASDGEYWLHVPAKSRTTDPALQIYCHKMPSYQPTAFLTLKTPQMNYAMDFAASATTYYSKIALDTEVAYIIFT